MISRVTHRIDCPYRGRTAGYGRPDAAATTVGPERQRGPHGTASPARADGLCRARRALRNAHQADDVVQTVFLVLLRRAASLSEGTPLVPWLFTVMRYAVADVQKLQRRRTHHEQAAGHAKEQQADAKVDTDDRLTPLLNDAIASLPAADRDAVVLRYLQGQSHREVSLQLGTTEAAVRQRLSRAVAKLRRFFAKRGVVATKASLSAALLVPADSGWSADDCLRAITRRQEVADSHVQGVLRAMRQSRIRTVSIGIAAAAALLATAGVLYSQAAQADGATSSASLGPTTAPTTQALSPVEVVRAAYRAAIAGDSERMASYFGTLDSGRRAKIDQLAELYVAFNGIRTAAVERFGAPALEQSASGMLGVSPQEMEALTEIIAADGASAVVDMGDVGPEKLALVKQNGQWLIDPAVIDTLNAQQLQGLHQRVPALKALATDVREGRVVDSNDLSDRLRAIIRPPR
ncbi:MAG: sigma-70 family RNA polymerase sigma factor [Tepidisphaeraceae bacterium]